MSDDTRLNEGVTGDIITTEEIAAPLNQGVAGLSENTYKIPRSKIVVGAYGIDGGDATHDTPLAVESRAARWAAEAAYVAALDQSSAAYLTRGRERITLTDSRGNLGHRGPRR